MKVLSFLIQYPKSSGRPTVYLTGILLLGLLFSSSGYAQQVPLNYFTIDANGADIVLEWEVQSEKFVEKFELYRKIDSDPTLTHVATLEPDGGLKYQFLDDNTFKTPPKVLSYELYIHIAEEEKVEKAFVSLTHNPTSIQRTWGSIKAMFR